MRFSAKVLFNSLIIAIMSIVFQRLAKISSIEVRNNHHTDEDFHGGENVGDKETNYEDDEDGR